MGKNKMVNVNDVIQKMMNHYDLDTLSELSEVLKVSQPTISKWRARNTIIPIKKRCRELGIYNEIFGSFSENVLTFSMSNIQKKLNIIETMIKDNKEIEDKFNEYLKGFIEDNL